MTLPNKHRGEMDVPGLGTLRYDWDRVAQLIAEFGEDFDSHVSESAKRMDLETIAKAAAIGLGIDVAAVKRASPPIIPTVGAVMAALNLAFHGQEAPPAAVANPPTRKTRRAMSSQKRAGKRSA